MTAGQQPWREPDRVAALLTALEERIVVLDGAMGTMIQALDFDENDFRGERLAEHPADLKGDNDVLVLTQPDAIAGIHRDFLEAGADIVTTNTFNATAIAQADYQAEALVNDINHEAARMARACVDGLDRPAWVAGALGPTNRTASMSPDVERPEFRNVDFDELRVAYGEAARALVAGGADLLMVETVFDTLNCKAALFAIDELFEDLGVRLPVWISGTVTDASGRTLSGQTASAFWYSVRHARPLLVGLNCALGAVEMRPWIQELARVADTRVSAHPNAGLPNELGEYDDTPDHMAEVLSEFASQGLVNTVGGCCGTTPAHISAIAAAVSGLSPRPLPGQ